MDGHPRYQAEARELTGHVRRVVRQRLAAIGERYDRFEEATFRQHDLFYGLTGIGVVLLQTDPGSESLAAILEYLVRLVRPRLLDGLEMPVQALSCAVTAL